ncbi:MAG: hypothetical protein IJ881_03935 [Neisseriaceae bacterium]|nr:hypothetical protein [Neisseriaceae bacterium]
MPYWVFKTVKPKAEYGKFPCFYTRNFVIREDKIIFVFSGFQAENRRYCDLIHRGETVVGVKTDYTNQEWAILKQKIQAA